MNFDNLSRNVEVHCPTCGGNKFSFDTDQEEENKIYKCAECGREMLKDDLLRENSENINQHVEEIGQQAVKQVEAALRKMLGNNKTITIKL